MTENDLTKICQDRCGDWGQLIALLSKTVVCHGCIPGHLDRSQTSRCQSGALTATGAAV